MESQVQGTKQEEIIFANCNPKFFLIYSSTYFVFILVLSIILKLFSDIIKDFYKCKDFYKRMLQHLSHARCSRQDKAIGEHFSNNNHKLSDMTLTVIERLTKNDIRYRKTKESIHIEQWNLKYRGLNRKK